MVTVVVGVCVGVAFLRVVGELVSSFVLVLADALAAATVSEVEGEGLAVARSTTGVVRALAREARCCSCACCKASVAAAEGNSNARAVEVAGGRAAASAVEMKIGCVVARGSCSGRVRAVPMAPVATKPVTAVTAMAVLVRRGRTFRGHVPSLAATLLVARLLNAVGLRWDRG